MLLTQMGHAFIGADKLSVGHCDRRLRVVGHRHGVLILASSRWAWWFFTREAPRVAENL